MSDTPTTELPADEALHWAAVAVGLKAARERDGMPLSASEQAYHERYQDAARAHGFTDQDIRDYQARL